MSSTRRRPSSPSWCRLSARHRARSFSPSASFRPRRTSASCCLYPMSKRRGEGNNWYALPHEARRELMQGHARVGRQWHGKVRQLITGSTGLDTMEWGVTLLAHDTFHIKGIVYQMRFDEVSVK